MNPPRSCNAWVALSFVVAFVACGGSPDPAPTTSPAPPSGAEPSADGGAPPTALPAPATAPAAPWTYVISTPSVDVLRCMAMDAAFNTLVAWTVKNGIHVEKLSPQGKALWAVEVASLAGNAAGTTSAQVVTDRHGDVFLAGGLVGDMKLGSTSLPSGSAEMRILVAKLSSKDGSALWTTTFGGGIGSRANGIVTDGDDVFVLGGTNQGSLLGRFRGADGGAGWASAWGGTRLMTLGIDSKKELWVAGYTDPSATDKAVSFGGETFSFSSASDLVLAKFGPDGAHRFSARYGEKNTDADTLLDATLDKDDNLVVAGYAGPLVDLGGGMLTPDSRTPFVAKLDASGKHVWSKSASSTGWGRPRARSGSLEVSAIARRANAADEIVTVDAAGAPLATVPTAKFITTADPYAPNVEMVYPVAATGLIVGGTFQKTASIGGKPYVADLVDAFVSYVP